MTVAEVCQQLQATTLALRVEVIDWSLRSLPRPSAGAQEGEGPDGDRVVALPIADTGSTLVVVFDERTSLGLVRLRARRAVVELAGILRLGRGRRWS